MQAAACICSMLFLFENKMFERMYNMIASDAILVYCSLEAFRNI